MPFIYSRLAAAAFDWIAAYVRTLFRTRCITLAILARLRFELIIQFVFEYCSSFQTIIVVDSSRHTVDYFSNVSLNWLFTNIKAATKLLLL